MLISFVSSTWDDSSSREEYEWEEEKDIAMIKIVHMEKNKWLKHGGSVVGHEVIHRRRLDGNSRLMLDYFCPNPVYPK